SGDPGSILSPCDHHASNISVSRRHTCEPRSRPPAPTAIAAHVLIARQSIPLHSPGERRHQKSSARAPVAAKVWGAPDPRSVNSAHSGIYATACHATTKYIRDVPPGESWPAHPAPIDGTATHLGWRLPANTSAAAAIRSAILRPQLALVWWLSKKSSATQPRSDGSRRFTYSAPVR